MNANSSGFGFARATLSVTIDGDGTIFVRSEVVISTVFCKPSLAPTKSIVAANSDFIYFMFLTIGCSLKLTMLSAYGNAMNLYCGCAPILPTSNGIA